LRLVSEKPRSVSIRVRLTAWYTLLLLLVLLAFSAALYLGLSRYLYADADALLEIDARAITSGLDYEGGRVRLDEAAPGPLAVYDPSNGKLLFGDPRLASRPAVVAALARVRSSGDPDVRSAVYGDDEQAWRVMTAPVVVNTRTELILQLARSLEDVETTLQRLLALILATIPLTLLVAAGGGLFLAGRALAPVDRITQAAAQIGAGDLSHRLEVSRSRDELGRLGVTLNDMIARLEEAFARQRRFAADASHELRTPLAVIRSQADVTLSRPRSEHEYREALEDIAAAADRMGLLIGDLLTLARADAGDARLTLTPEPFGEFAAGVVEQLQPLALERRVGLLWLGDEPGPIVQGDRMRLTQLTLNLVDNALKNAPEGVVRVSVRQEGESAVFEVSDNGIGIASEHLPHIFDRFYRIDEARSRREGGVGLGLSICDWIARAHGGSIHVESEPGLGSTFTVTLPLAGPRD